MTKYMDYLVMNTQYMTPEEKKDHESLCAHIRTNFLTLEAVASQNLWIWHAFFGVLEFNNDLNVLNQSPLFSDILQVGVSISRFEQF